MRIPIDAAKAKAELEAAGWKRRGKRWVFFLPNRNWKVTADSLRQALRIHRDVLTATGKKEVGRPTQA